ncbi:inorganic phosphate transporter [Litchfieldia salsa]|uniref:Sulfate permease n=1 Tax=Litchfieldia salsa TaxID=930152 RepID=A0A1H0WTB6_9BACI|nr:inorganic phosphate transporter [Litchfieldia salsa]SDP94014.1 sulfate permease [Litchfieldia salsa]
MILTYVAIAVALFFAMNIGASGTAASMGAPYGSGAIKNKKLALLLVAISAFLGAVIGGGEVVKTIGNGIIPSDTLTVSVVVIILAGATFTLFLSNLIGIPLSTSEVTVGSIVGVGAAYHAVYTSKLLVIISFWIIIPVVSFFLTLLLGKMINYVEKRWPQLQGQGKWAKWLSTLLIIGGCFEAFSAGMNNVANSIGPLVGAGILSTEKGILLGAIFTSIGAILLGGKVLETNGKKITKLSLLQGSAVSFTGGGLVVIASLFGLPIPLTQVTTCGILGVGTAKDGLKVLQKNVIKRIAMVWVISPLASLVVSYSLINLFTQHNLYNILVIFSTLIATVGSMYLIKLVRKEKRTLNDDKI